MSAVTIPMLSTSPTVTPTMRLLFPNTVDSHRSTGEGIVKFRDLDRAGGVTPAARQEGAAECMGPSRPSSLEQINEARRSI